MTPSPPEPAVTADWRRPGVARALIILIFVVAVFVVIPVVAMLIS